MRICRRMVAVAFICFPIASVALLADEVERHEPEVDMFASMAGKCSTLKVGERDFACTSVAFSHSPGGRSGFIVPLNDPDDDTHIITFSGEKSKRGQDNLYELSIDQVLLKSKDRPKADGLPYRPSSCRLERASRSEISRHNRCPASLAAPPTETAGNMNSSLSRMARLSG